MNDTTQNARGVPPASAGEKVARGEAAAVDCVAWFQWVRHADVAAKIDKGWIVAQSGPCHHNHYAVLMQMPEVTP